MIYTVRQFAKMFGVTQHTVRYYTDIGILPCLRDEKKRRAFNEESANWMQGIACLKGCGASIDDIREYCRLCRLPESKETMQARYKIICRQREQAYKRIDEAKAVAKYMDDKVKHYEDILAGLIPDDTNPGLWTDKNRPKNIEKCAPDCMTGRKRYSLLIEWHYR